METVYGRFPEGQRKPVIGITGNYEDLTCKLGKGYYQKVVEAGGVPVIIPPVTDQHVLINTLDRIDALILSGGGDYNPLWAGEEPSPLLHGINAERDEAELMITRLAYNRQIPMLGIETAKKLIKIAEKSDGLCGRLGNDQFAILLPERAYNEEVLLDTEIPARYMIRQGFCHISCFTMKAPRR